MQEPNKNPQRAKGDETTVFFWNLNFVFWNFFGAWSLGFVIYYLELGIWNFLKKYLYLPQHFEYTLAGSMQLVLYRLLAEL
ncbi:hypothetical protein ABIE54_005241 [Chitinophagaceae bacterium OAS944]